MKKIKKLLAMIMAMTMVLGLGLTSFAEKDGATITVNGLYSGANQIVSIYELYKLDADDNAWVKASWLPNDVNETNIKDRIDDVVVEALKQSPTATKNSNKAGSVEFKNDDPSGVKIQAGAYLVLVQDTSNPTKVTYSPMIAITYKYDGNSLIAPLDQTVTAKAESYHTEKTLNDDNNVVAVGDIIEYTITATVPYNNEKYGEKLTEFKVTDTLTGATYYLPTQQGAKFEVKVNGIDWDDLELGELTQPIPADVPGTEATSIIIDLIKLINADNTFAGQQVTITYTAKVSAVDEITNTANAGSDSSTTEVTAWTGNMQITKYGELTEDDKEPTENTPKLSGAEFVIARKKADIPNEYEYAILSFKDQNDKSSAYITGEWVDEIEAATHVVTGTDGIAEVKGLDVGTYYFKEVVAPDGYSVDPEMAECEVKIVESATGEIEKVYGETIMIDTKLASLPSTGGIGTTIFTIGGCAIMIAAAALYFVNRRKSEEN